MADTIELKIGEYVQLKFKCATCDNNITELRAMNFPICDDCFKALREIISERRKPKVVEIGGVEYMERKMMFNQEVNKHKEVRRMK